MSHKLKEEMGVNALASIFGIHWFIRSYIVIRITEQVIFRYKNTFHSKRNNQMEYITIGDSQSFSLFCMFYTEEQYFAQ